MSEHARRRLFALVSLLVAGAVAALVALSGESEEASPRAGGAVSTGPPAAPVRPLRGHSPPAPSPRATDPASPGPGGNPERARKRERLGSPAFLRREKPRVLAAAQRFLRAFYAYDAGNHERQVIADIRARVTPALARHVLRAPRPRLPATMQRAPPPARVLALSAEFDQPPTSAVVRVKTARGARENVSGVVLRLKRGRWRASQLTE